MSKDGAQIILGSGPVDIYEVKRSGLPVRFFCLSKKFKLFFRSKEALVAFFFTKNYDLKTHMPLLYIDFELPTYICFCFEQKIYQTLTLLEVYGCL